MEPKRGFLVINIGYRCKSTSLVSYVEPALPLLLLLAFVGVFTAWRASATNQRPWLLTLSFIGLLLISWSPVAWLLSRPLEIWYEQAPMPREMADAIVVLSGAYIDASPVRPYQS